MNERLHKAVQYPKERSQQSYDFDESSDLCDFGYALAPRDDSKGRAASKPAESTLPRKKRGA